MHRKHIDLHVKNIEKQCHTKPKKPEKWSVSMMTPPSRSRDSNHTSSMVIGWLTGLVSYQRKLKNLMTGINYYIVHMKIVYHQPATQQITGLTSTPSFLWNTCHQPFTGCLHICSYSVSVIKSNICMHLLESFNKGWCQLRNKSKKRG